MDKKWLLIIGAGFALFPIHNKWLTDLMTTDGQVSIFIPTIGAVLWIIGSMMYLTWHKVPDFGPKKIWMPLVIIVLCIGFSGINYDGAAKIAPFFMGVALFCVYLVGRVAGKEIFYPIAIGAAISSLGIIVSSIINPGIMTGGLVFEKNYNIASAYILIGSICAVYADLKWKWVLASISLVALFFSGSAEMVFIMAVLSLFILVRRDWGKRLVIILIPLVIVSSVWFGLGYGQKLYSYTGAVATNTTIDQLPVGRSADGIEGNTMLERRWTLTRDAFQNISLFGEGYNITQFDYATAHSIPGVIVQQLGYFGIIAMVLWLWISLLSLIRTKWKYLWMIILAMAVFDHYLWTQLAPVWWLSIGISGGSNWLFRKA